MGQKKNLTRNPWDGVCTTKDRSRIWQKCSTDKEKYCSFILGAIELGGLMETLFRSDCYSTSTNWRISRISKNQKKKKNLDVQISYEISFLRYQLPIHKSHSDMNLIQNPRLTSIEYFHVKFQVKIPMYLHYFICMTMNMNTWIVNIHSNIYTTWALGFRNSYLYLINLSCKRGGTRN